MHTLYSCLFGLFLLLGAVSCSLDHSQPTDTTSLTATEPETEWTVLVYGASQYAGDRLDDGRSRTLATIQSFESVYPSERVRVVALTGRENSAECSFFELGHQATGPGGELHTSAISNWGERDLSDPAVLRAFVDSAITRCPARRYMLIISGYGDGWRGACLNEPTASLMTLPELTTVLQAVTETHSQTAKIDLLMWMVPKMGMLEVAYQCRTVADYVIASPTKVPQDHSLAAKKWLLDLTLNPEMSAERLGQFVLARLRQTAEERHDITASYALLRTDGAAAVLSAMGELSSELGVLLPDHASDLATLWQNTWVPSTDDSAALDLSALARGIQEAALFADRAGLLAAAGNVEDALHGAILESFTTRENDSRRGLTVYFPIQADSVDLAEYTTLNAARDAPAWTNFLASLTQDGAEFVRVTGRVRWPGQALSEVFLFVNTAQTGGQATVALTAPVTLADFLDEGDAAYDAQFVLGADSLEAYIGLFRDLDHSQTLSSGDRYGYYHLQHPLRDWLTIHRADELSDMHVELNRTQQ